MIEVRSFDLATESVSKSGLRGSDYVGWKLQEILLFQRKELQISPLKSGFQNNSRIRKVLDETYLKRIQSPDGIF